MINQGVRFAATAFLWINLTVVSAFAENAKPLGYEVGVSSYDDIITSLGRKAHVADAGTNRYTQGKVLKVGGAGLNIKGLDEVTFVFDNKKTLTGVLMSLPKAGLSAGSEDYSYAGFYEIYNDLQRKYTLTKQSLPVVGHLFAQFKKGDSTIEIEADEASPRFEVRYLGTTLIEAYHEVSRQKIKSIEEKSVNTALAQGEISTN